MLVLPSLSIFRQGRGAQRPPAIKDLRFAGQPLNDGALFTLTTVTLDLIYWKAKKTVEPASGGKQLNATQFMKLIRQVRLGCSRRSVPATMITSCRTSAASPSLASRSDVSERSLPLQSTHHARSYTHFCSLCSKLTFLSVRARLVVASRRYRTKCAIADPPYAEHCLQGLSNAIFCSSAVRIH